MSIKPSASAEVRQLIAALAGDDDVRREVAIARLAVIGPRAVEGLRRAYAAAADRETKIAVLRALESSGDRRTIAIARQAIGEGGDVAVAAAAALRGLLDSPHNPTSTDALDVLVATALDPTFDRRIRLAAFDALHGIPEGVRSRVAEALRGDRDKSLLAQAIDSSRELAASEAVWQDALDGQLPDRPEVLREAAAARAPAAALGSLQKLIDAIRSREATVPNARRTQWQALRGALHQALALRGSRIAVYDLRESLEGSSAPLPSSFLAALHLVGDPSCLEAIAGAYVRAPAADTRWKSQLAAAFRAITSREKITRRHASMKRAIAHWPDAIRNLRA